MYKNIFFDFDGTLFDTGEGILKSVQYSALEFGFDEPDISKLRSFVGPPLQDSFMRRFGVDEKTAEKMISKFRERYSTIGVFECKPYPEIFELILELKNLGYGLSIATGKPTVFALEILERYGFKDLKP